MAKQGGPFLFNFTRGGVSFYIREGIGLVRTKSNLDAHRVKTDPAFKNSRKSADHFGIANKMASTLYKTIPIEFREKIQFIALRNLGVELFRAGASSNLVQKTMEQAIQNLIHNLKRPTEDWKDAENTKEKKPVTAMHNNPIAPPNLIVFPPCANNIHRSRRKRVRRSPGRAAPTAAAQHQQIRKV